MPKNFKIWDESYKDNVDDDQVYFRLTQCDGCFDGSIQLVVCNNEGECLESGSILSITNSGKLDRDYGITGYAGLCLTKHGKIRELK